MDALAEDLADAGGLAAPRERAARLRVLLTSELRRGRADLANVRSGLQSPVTVVFAAGLAVLPVDPALRAYPQAAPERAWLLCAAALGALHEAGGTGAPQAGAWDDHLVLHLQGADPELAELAFDDQVAPVDRLRARALALPAHVFEPLHAPRDPIGAAHPMLVAGRIAALGGRPADPTSVDAHEEAVLAEGTPRPHDDPDPALRVARRIVQRLHGMGKWGGYHTDFTHLSRGFAPADRALAARVGEALLKAGLLAEKRSVGQRHVFLDPGHAPEIHALIDRGEVPSTLRLPVA